MDSLELPIDLIWEGKIEPLSPNQLALVNTEDIMIFDNDLCSDFFLNLNHSNIIFDGKKSPEEFIFELQQDIIEQDDDDQSTQWLDEPISLPISAEYSLPLQQRHPLKTVQTAQLLQEFNSVFDAVELTHLTPPQTPPASPQIENLNDLKLDQFIFSSTPQSQQPIILNSNLFNFDQSESVQSPECSQDIAHEMEVVEELVRSCAENLPDFTSDDDNSSQSSRSPNSSPRSSSDDSFDNASQSFSNDDEWTPTPEPTPTKRRIRSSEDKSKRKREQNKNAATRYRIKKKAESDVVLGEERELQEKNDKLQVKYTDIKREINYLKSLMRDLYRAKGLL